jgi:hypothetical protein
MGALDVRCLYEIHTIRYLNYLLNISHDFIYIIGSRSIWILGSSIVYWAGKEVVSRQGGRHLVDLPLCQYRLCNISNHTISVFGIKACIRRMSHIMFSASCQPLTVPRSFDPSCITTNFGGGCLLY